jgi:predicted HAD superfamily hydrolase
VASITSFDVWDTLIRRKCHPDAIKIFSWERYLMTRNGYLELISPSKLLSHRQKVENKIALESLAKGLDDEYKIDQIFTGGNEYRLDEHIDFEISLELANSYRSKRIQKHLKSLDPLEMILISDFYMSSKQLSKIVHGLYPELTNVPLVTSAEIGLNKRSGRLYDHLRLEPFWTHVGDNPHSDFFQARVRGSKSKLFRPKGEEIVRLKNTRRFEKRLNGNLEVSAGIDQDLKIAIGLLGFCAWLSASSKGKILFLEREGIFLHKFYQQFQRNNPWELRERESELISVSRLSTIAGAFHKNPIGVLERLLRQYKDIDIQRLSKTLGIGKDLFPIELSKLSGLSLISGIVQNHGLISELIAATSENYESTFSYLQSFGLPADVTCVDIGWSGTIQANLGDILGESYSLEGRYLAMRRESTRIPEKIGFFDNYSYATDFFRLMRALRPVEMLFNSNIGSTVSYKLSEDKVEPVRSLSVDGIPRAFEMKQDRILLAYDKALEFIRENLLTLNECASIGLRGLSDFVSEPDHQLLEDYLGTFHNEDFGLGVEVYPGSIRVRLRDVIASLKGDSSRLREIYWEVGWPEALAKSTLGFLPGKRAMRIASKLVWK